MKHKFFTLLFAILASLGTMFAEKVQIGNLYYNLDASNQTAEVTSSGGDYSGAIVIPASVNYDEVEYHVTSIGERAFYDCTGLTSVTIPNSVTSIGGGAFWYCTGLTGFDVAADNPNYCSEEGVLFSKDKTTLVAYPGGNQDTYVIPNSVTSIETQAFYECNGLTSVTIPNSVTSIGEEAFRGCSGLTSIIVENGNTSFDSRNNCNAIIETATNTLIAGCKNTTIPNSVTSIGDCAFFGCSGLTSIEIPNSVTSIGSEAFAYCSGLTSVTIPNSVTSIGEKAFSNCLDLISVTIPNSVTSIGMGAFACCFRLTSVTIPNSVTSIGDGAFSNCHDLTSVTIGNSVTSIGSGTFEYCSGLTSITIGNNVTSIGKHAFYNCSGLTSVTIPNSVTSIGERAFYRCTSLTSVAIPNSVTSIGVEAFYDCTGLTSLTIPSSVISIGGFAFNHCGGLTSVIVENGNTVYDSRNNCNAIINTVTNTLIIGSNNTIIPNSVTGIGTSAFSNRIGLTSIDIPGSVTGIGTNAFRYCTGLTSITIPNSVTSIGNYAFRGCSSLTSVTNYATTPQGISSNVFFEVNISACTLYVPAESVDAYKAADVWKEFGNILAIEESGEVKVLSIAEAIQIGMALDSMATSAETYTIEGYVINAGTFYAGTKDQNWYMADDQETASSDFQAFRCYPIDGIDTVEVRNGSKVRMTGHLQKYYDRQKALYVVEMTYTPAIILSKPQIDTITVAEALALGAELEDNASTSKQYAIRGYVSSVSSYYEQLGYQNFYIADDPNSTANTNAVGGFYVFRGIPSTGTAVNKGDLVELTCAIRKYVSASGTNIYIENSEFPVSVTVLQAASDSCIIASGTCGAQGDNLTWTLTCDSILTISGTGEMADYEWNVSPFFSNLSISSVVIEDGVTSIGEYIFNLCSNIKEVVIPNSVTTIGFGAFILCTSLVTIEIPDSVTSIGESSFSNCTSLTAVTIGSNVTRIEGWAFENNNSLISFTSYCTTPPTIDISRPAFVGSYLSTCTLYVPAESVEAYQTANGWKEFGIILPIEDDPAPCIIASGTCGAQGDNLTWTLTCDSVLTISGTGAMADFAYTTAPWFEYRYMITSAIIGMGVTSIGKHSLQECKNMTSVQISNSVTSIGNHAFWECYGLTTISIPKGVIYIGTSAFMACPYLLSFVVATDNPVFSSVDGVIFNKNKTVLLRCPEGKPVSYSIPAGTVTIGEDAFYGCAELTSITFPESIKSIKNFAFGYCSGLTNFVLPNSLDSIGTQAFQSCRNITTIIIPNNVTYIGSSSFAYCNNLTTIEIPASVSDIGSGAFKDCNKLVSINVVTDNLNYSSENGVLFSKDKKKLIQYPAGKSETSYSIPSTVESINEEAFSGCIKLNNIEISNSVTNIGRGAFSYCSTLISVEIPNTVRRIGELAFYECYNLTSVVIGSHVANIGRSAFDNCGNLDSLKCKAVAPPSLGTTVFDGVNKSIPLYVPVGSGDAYVAADQWKDFTNIQEMLEIPDTPTPCVIASGTCGAQGDNLTWTLTCDSVLTISGTGVMADYELGGAPWYSNKKAIRSVIIEDGVTSIGDGAFYYCIGLTSIEVPNSVTSIGNYAFAYCFAVNSVEAPAIFFELPETEWVNYTKILTHVMVNSGELTENALKFLNRSYKTLRSLDLSEVSNTEFADEAFSGYYNLTELKLPQGLTSVSYMMVAGCKNLEFISIPETVTEIDQSAFEDCRSITVVDFGEKPSLTKIGSWAFYNCHELENIDIPEGVTEIGSAAFYGCAYTQTAHLPASVRTIGDNAFALCSRIKKMVVDAVTPPDVENKTFFEVSTIAPVYVPDESVTDYKSHPVWGKLNIVGRSEAPTATDNIQSNNAQSAKVLRNGQIFILRGDKTYTLQGQETIVP